MTARQVLTSARALLLTFCLMPALAGAAILSRYDFDGDLGDSLGNGPDLTALGGTIRDGRYVFDHNQGLKLVGGMLSTTTFGIELGFKVDDLTDGYNKLIDFGNLGRDQGLYVLNGTVAFFQVGDNGGYVQSGVDYKVGISRADNAIKVFLDDALIFAAADNSDAVSTNNILHFFVDDVQTGQTESFAGSVDYILIHEDASTVSPPPPPPAVVPVPAAGWLLLCVVAPLMRRGLARA